MAGRRIACGCGLAGAGFALPPRNVPLPFDISLCLARMTTAESYCIGAGAQLCGDGGDALGDNKQ
jgi:hypothetical protein